MPEPYKKYIGVCNRAIAIYSAVAVNCALSPVARHKAEADAYNMNQLKKFLYRCQCRTPLLPGVG